MEKKLIFIFKKKKKKKKLELWLVQNLQHDVKVCVRLG